MSKKKRNGSVVVPSGREEISARVFDLLAEDIAYRLSCDYAETLWYDSMFAIDRLFDEFDDFIDHNCTFGTLFQLIGYSDSAMERLEAEFESLSDRLEDELEQATEKSNRELSRILAPAIRLCSSYEEFTLGTYDGSDVDLDMTDVLMAVESDKTLSLLDGEDMSHIAPHVARLMDEDTDNPSLGMIFQMIGGGIADIFGLKKNLKRWSSDLRYSMKYNDSLSQEEIQSEAYSRILAYMQANRPGSNEYQEDSSSSDTDWNEDTDWSEIRLSPVLLGL